MFYESEVDDKLAVNIINQAKEELTRMSLNDEPKRLVEDAAKLLGLTPDVHQSNGALLCIGERETVMFNPLDPERGDLMKVAEAAELDVDFTLREVEPYSSARRQPFTKGDHQSLTLAILRAASAVLHSRGGV